jgi:hypothetical protein
MSKIHTAIAGEYAVMAQLALHGLDVNITLRNTKGIDIIASNPDSGKMYRVQVKTTSIVNGNLEDLYGRTIRWQMNVKHLEIKDDLLIYAFVLMDKEFGNFRFFLLPNDVVVRAVLDEHQRYLDKSGNNVHSDDRAFRMGLDDKYDYFVPLTKYCENKWELFA